MLSDAPPPELGLRIAFEEALTGYQEGGLPIGAALVYRGEMIGRGSNRRVQEGNPILHAEMSCFQNAGRLPTGAADWLRSHGITVTVADNPACYELLQRFITECPDIWAEDIGASGVDRRYDQHREAKSE